MNLPTITSTQQKILILLYRYRFLERKQKQIQTFLGHTNKSRTIRWLKELRENQYVDWIHDPDDPATISTPAIYFLSVNGIRLLRQLKYPEVELRKRYKDRYRQQDFVSRCLLLANCALHLEVRNNNPDDPVHYTYAVETDNEYNFVAKSEHIHPNLVFTKTQDDKAGNIARATYLVELLDTTTPRYMVKKNIKDYIEYLASDKWELALREMSSSLFLQHLVSSLA